MYIDTGWFQPDSIATRQLNMSVIQHESVLMDRNQVPILTGVDQNNAVKATHDRGFLARTSHRFPATSRCIDGID